MSYSSRGGRQDSRYRSSDRHTSGGSRPEGTRSRSGQSGRNSRTSRSTRGTRGTTSSRDHGRSTNRSSSRTRNLTGPDTGYTLHSHRVNYSRRRGADRYGFVNGRFILLLVIVVVVVVVIIAGISSCVAGSSSSRQQEQQTDEQTESKPRVASGISSDLTTQFNAVLDRDDQMAQIAQNADQYDDERLLQLALNEPEAVSFVANYLTADKSASSYTDTVTQGQVPQLYDWDTRWGYVSYGDGCIGVTGSAPTTIAMAYMGLTGKSDITPATIAQGVSMGSGSSTASSSTNSNSSSTNANRTSSTSTTSSSASDSADSVIQLMSQVGLEATQYDSSSETLVACLSSTSVAAVYVSDDGLQDNRDAHWALVVGMNQDGTLNVFDPTSSLVSTRTWDSSTIARASSTILYVTVSESSQSTESDGDSDVGSSSSSTGSSSSSDYNGSDSSSSSSSGSNSSGSSTSSGSSSSNTNNSNSNRNSSSSSSSSGSSSSGDYVGL